MTTTKAMPARMAEFCTRRTIVSATGWRVCVDSPGSPRSRPRSRGMYLLAPPFCSTHQPAPFDFIQKASSPPFTHMTA